MLLSPGLVAAQNGRLIKLRDTFRIELFMWAKSEVPAVSIREGKANMGRLDCDEVDTAFKWPSQSFLACHFCAATGPGLSSKVAHLQGRFWVQIS